MRHLRTVIAAILVGPLSWLLFAAGQDRSAQAFANAADGGVPDGADLLRPLLVLAAAGILLGLIATLRISPLGAAVAGLIYSASYLALLVSPGLVTTVFDHTLTLAGYRVDLMAPVRNGTSLLVGSLLLVGVVSIRRWRRWPEPAGDAPAALAPDEIIPAVKEKDRPVGVDGLGLGRPAAAPEPEPVAAGGQGWASRSDGAGGQGWAGRTDWANLLSGRSEARPTDSSDWTRPSSR
ncbi:hypothetical protein [Micromonospora thermarum]|uniref:hypothetical protein n=1 Tax=Micromonospora thermarum TaxID=2720024 RepID=UPI001F0E9972|nr:hypothetical protein [Micromonospora thermarum]